MFAKAGRKFLNGLFWLPRWGVVVVLAFGTIFFFHQMEKEKRRKASSGEQLRL